MTPITLFFDAVAIGAGVSVSLLLLAVATLIVLALWASVAAHIPESPRRVNR
jgi:hypothetical protein